MDAVTTPERKEAVEQYRAQCASKSDLERTDLSKEKTGVFTGAHAVNPVNGEQIPVWIAGLCADGLRNRSHHGRSRPRRTRLRFAGVFGLPVLQVVQPPTEDTDWRGYCGYEGTSVNSGFLTGLPTPEAKEKMILWLEERGKGRRKVNYKLRDWLFSASATGGSPSPSSGKTAATAPFRKRTSPAPARSGRLRAHGRPPRAAGQGHGMDRLHAHGAPGNQHHAPVGRLLLVLPALSGPEKQRTLRQPRGGTILDGLRRHARRRGPVRGRHGTRRAPPALRPLLAQGPL